MQAESRTWLRRVGWSLLLALASGLLAYLVVRGVLGAWLLVRQQQLLREVVGAVQNGLEAPSADLRSIRLQIQAFDARNDTIGIVAGFLTAALAAAGCYVWLERRGSG